MSKHDFGPAEAEQDLPTTDRAYELIEALTSSQTRLQILDVLRNGPAQKQELADQCGVTNSTAGRNCDDLEEKGIISEVRNREYQLTPLGERIARTLASCMAEIDQTWANQGLIKHYQGRPEIPADVLADLTVDTASSDNAQKALREYIEAVKSEETNAAEVRMLGGTTGPVIIDVIKELVDTAEHVDITVSESAATSSPSGFTKRAREGSLPENFDLRIYPGDIRFGLIIIGDQRAMLGAYDERGDVQAGAQGESETVINWANNIYETFQGRAHLIEREK